MAAWVTIAVCTLVIAILQFIAMSSQALMAIDSSPGFNMIYMGRVGVGMKEALGHTDASILPNLDYLAEESSYPGTNALRSAIIAGELNNRDEAMWRLSEALPEREFSGEAGRPEKAWPDHHEMRSGEVHSDHTLLARIYSDDQFIPTAAERDQLVERHGWFGELAAGFNLPSTDPDHASPRDAAADVVWFVIIGVGVIILALLCGVALLILLVILLIAGKAKPLLVTGVPGHRTAYVEALAIFMLGFLVLQVIAGIVLELGDLDLTWLMLLLLVLPIFWPLVCGVSWRKFKDDMGWVAPRGVLREIGLGIAGYVAGLPIIAIGMLITALVAFMTELGADHPIGHEMVSGEGHQAILLVIAAVVWAPLVEECVFRAALYRHMRNPPGWLTWLTASVVSSFVFAAIHPQGIVGIPALMAIAFVLASLREMRGSLIPSITAHAVHNGLIMSLLLVVLYY